MEKQPLLNTFINNVDMNETLTEIEEMISKEKKSYIVAINVDVVMKIENDQYLKKIVDNADMVLVDGKPLVWISKMHGRPLKAKISGSDLVPLLCEVAAKNRQRNALKKNCRIFQLLEHMHHRWDLKKIKRNLIKLIK